MTLDVTHSPDQDPAAPTSQDLQDLRAALREFLATASAEHRVRAAMATPSGHDQETWRRLVSDFDVLGDETHQHLAALAAISEELGRALFCGPWLATGVLGVAAAQATANSPWSAERFADLRSGNHSMTVAITDADTPGSPIGLNIDDQWFVTGLAPAVLDGHVANSLILFCNTESGPGAFGIDPHEQTVRSRPLPVLDQTRRQADLEFTSTPAVLLAHGDTAAAVAADLRQRASALLAVEQVGGAQRAMEMAVDYARGRFQFGRPIGSFQAIQHACADMFIAVEGARSIAAKAVDLLAASAEEAPTVLAAARSFCAETFVSVAEANIQVHGGLGVTWEHPAHLYLKRARGSEALFGSSLEARAEMMDRLGLHG